MTTGTPVGRIQTARRVRVGDSVVIVSGRLSGQSGVVELVERNPSCGCLSVFVRTEAGEWVGAPSEVEVR